MKREVRTFRNIEVRAVDEKGPNGRPVVQLRIITPNVVDDYGSVWLPDTFDTALQARIAADPDDTPALCWSHRWDDPIGHGITYTADAGGPVMRFEYDDFDAVPRAKQADAQVRSKTIRDCSVGFFAIARREASEDDKKRWPGAREVITEADLDEVSLVLRGAVPGAKVLRSAGGTVDVDAVVELARRVTTGELTAEEAKVAVELLGEDNSTDETDPQLGEGAGHSAETDDAKLDTELDTELDAALDVAFGRNARR